MIHDQTLCDQCGTRAHTTIRQPASETDWSRIPLTFCSYTCQNDWNDKWQTWDNNPRQIMSDEYKRLRGIQ